MGKHVENPRYEVVSTRLSDSELRALVSFADDRKIGITAAVRMLIMTGIELLDGGADNAA